MAILTIADGDRELTAAAAERITTHVERAIAERGSALISLTGGTTPRHLYEALADEAKPWRTRIAWPHLHLFWSDERHVPPDHRDSNFGMAFEALVRHVPLPSSQVHRMRGELADAGEAAREYDDELRTAFAAADRSDLTFDVMLLGMGDDAHIASVFPGSEVLRHPIEGHPADRVKGERVAAVWAEHLHAWRITLTPPALLDARSIVMLVAGDKKAAALHAALERPRDVFRWPAQLLREADDRVEWLVDRAAASQLHAGR